MPRVTFTIFFCAIIFNGTFFPKEMFDKSKEYFQQHSRRVLLVPGSTSDTDGRQMQLLLLLHLQSRSCSHFTLHNGAFQDGRSRILTRCGDLESSSKATHAYFV